MLDSYSPPPVHTTSILLFPMGGKDKLMGFQSVTACLVKWLYLQCKHVCVDLSGDNVIVNVRQCAFSMYVW